jgi:hypothetical protein
MEEPTFKAWSVEGKYLISKLQFDNLQLQIQFSKNVHCFPSSL